MTNSINYQNPQNSPYSGITINITNPTINPPNANHICAPNCPAHNVAILDSKANSTYPNHKFANPEQYGASLPNNQVQDALYQQNDFSKFSKEQVGEVLSVDNADATAANDATKDLTISKPQEGIPQAYPPQYYLNNYNYIQNGEKGAVKATAPTLPVAPSNSPNENQLITQQEEITPNNIQEENMSSSKEIINGLEARVNEQKELEKNGKQTKVVALTNEYIMSLENYLNNPNTEIRLMAAKEILTRLDEDKNRFDDAALNALLNKMLQDPEKLVRIAALSAFSSQLASGNDYTVQLLTKIQNNPNADKEDALQAANGLLKMSSRTEIRYTPQYDNYVAQPQAEQ